MSIWNNTSFLKSQESEDKKRREQSEREREGASPLEFALENEEPT